MFSKSNLSMGGTTSQDVMQILFGRHSNSKPVLLERGKRYSSVWKVGRL